MRLSYLGLLLPLVAVAGCGSDEPQPVVVTPPASTSTVIMPDKSGDNPVVVAPPGTQPPIVISPK